MANEPWSEAEELELRAIEASLIAHATPSGHPVIPAALASPTQPTSPSPARSAHNSRAWSLSQEIDAMQSLPWTEEEEKAVREVEERAFAAVQARGLSLSPKATLTPRRLCDPASPLPQPSVAELSLSEGSGQSRHSTAVESTASTPPVHLLPSHSLPPVTTVEPHGDSQLPTPPSSGADLGTGPLPPVFSPRLPSITPGSSPLYRPRRRGHHTFGAEHFLDLEAQESGSDFVSGSDTESASGEASSQDPFLVSASQTTQTSVTDMHGVYRLGLLSQNVLGGPQFQDAPRRRGPFGGAAVLRMTHYSPSQSSIDSFPSQPMYEGGYHIGSFVQDDDEPIEYDTDASASPYAYD
ncbi:hypothetical protein EV715DRAFT_297728 [Schizophyllum commune]